MTDDKPVSEAPPAVADLQAKLRDLSPNRQRRRELQAKARKRKRANRR